MEASSCSKGPVKLATCELTESTYTFLYRTGRENKMRWAVIVQNETAYCASLQKHSRAAHSSTTLTFLVF